jgi:hypothetical protein
VAADVFACRQQGAVGTEQAGRVQRARALEERLSGAQALGQRRQQRGPHAHVVGDRGATALGEGRDLALAAHPAGGGRREAVEAVAVRDPGARREPQPEDVVALLGGDVAAVAHLEDLLAPRHDPFGEQEAGGQLEVGPGRTHRRHQRQVAVALLHAQLERLLTADDVAVGAPAGRRVAVVLRRRSEVPHRHASRGRGAAHGRRALGGSGASGPASTPPAAAGAAVGAGRTRTEPPL